jgi:hypothetical protein
MLCLTCSSQPLAQRFAGHLQVLLAPSEIVAWCRECRIQVALGSHRFFNTIPGSSVGEFRLLDFRGRLAR